MCVVVEHTDIQVSVIALQPCDAHVDRLVPVEYSILDATLKRVIFNVGLGGEVVIQHFFFLNPFPSQSEAERCLDSRRNAGELDGGVAKRVEIQDLTERWGENTY